MFIGCFHHPIQHEIPVITSHFFFVPSVQTDDENNAASNYLQNFNIVISFLTTVASKGKVTKS